MAKKIISGTDLQLSFEGKFIGCSTSNSFSSSVDMKDAACKESGQFYDAEPGMFTATLSTEGLVIVDNPVDATAMRAAEIFDLHLNKTRIQWVFTTGVSGETQIAGEGFITSFELTAPDKDNATYSCEVQVVGAYAQTAVA
jgi:hypothetical protein